MKKLDLLVRGMDTRIRIRVCTKMSRIRNTVYNDGFCNGSRNFKTDFVLTSLNMRKNI